MAEKKEKKIISADDGREVAASEVKNATIKSAKPTGNAGGLRIGAVILWILAIGFEVLAVLVAVGKMQLSFMPSMAQLIIYLVLDLICVVIGSQLWKKANHIHPASKSNPTLFWLWNNLGVIISVVAFFPFILIALTNKDMDKKTKAIAVVVAIIALLISGLAGYDFNPISSEEQQAAMHLIEGDVYWSPFGHVYHTSPDCSSLNQSDTLTKGSVEQAIAANRTRLCSFCAKRDNLNTDGVLTDKAEE